MVSLKTQKETCKNSIPNNKDFHQQDHRLIMPEKKLHFFWGGGLNPSEVKSEFTKDRKFQI